MRKMKRVLEKTKKLFTDIKEKSPKPEKKKISSLPKAQKTSLTANGILNASEKEKRKSKSVKFNEEVKIQSIDRVGNRSWNDSKKKRELLNRGKFSEEEVKILMTALCTFVQQNNLGEEGLVTLCSKSKEDMSEELKGAWCKIAESLQSRSVQSCHNFCRRKFNPNNYNGKWSEEEEQKLSELVKDLGHSWKSIALSLNSEFERDEDQELRFGRTPENVKDKWKQMGGENMDFRKKGPWTLEEGL